MNTNMKQEMIFYDCWVQQQYLNMATYALSSPPSLPSLTLRIHTRPTTTLSKIYRSIQGPKGGGYIIFPLQIHMREATILFQGTSPCVNPIKLRTDGFLTLHLAIAHVLTGAIFDKQFWQQVAKWFVKSYRILSHCSNLSNNTTTGLSL